MEGEANRDSESSLATRAAWLHYVAGLTQAEVARRLGLPSLKAHRLIMRANQEGLVKIHIEGEISECVELEQAMIASHGLQYCEVVPSFGPDNSPLKALGVAGAHFLKREMERDNQALIGMGHGRTIAACVENLPRHSAKNVQFVSMLGGLTRNFSANPHDVIHRLAERTGAEAYFMPVPFIANSAADRSILINQQGVRGVVDRAANAQLVFVGIGTTETEASIVSTGMVGRDEIEAVRQAGCVGELLGHFFSAEGEPMEADLSRRILTLDRELLGSRRIVAVAGGEIKLPALRAILKSGLLNGLITDELTAKALTKNGSDKSRRYELPGR